MTTINPVPAPIAPDDPQPGGPVHPTYTDPVDPIEPEYTDPVDEESDPLEEQGAD